MSLTNSANRSTENPLREIDVDVCTIGVLGNDVEVEVDVDVDAAKHNQRSINRRRSDEKAHSRLKLGIFSCLDLFAFRVLSIAKETGEGGGAGGRVSWRWSFVGFVFVDDDVSVSMDMPMMAREMSSGKVAKASLAVVGGERVVKAILMDGLDWIGLYVVWFGWVGGRLKLSMAV